MTEQERTELKAEIMQEVEERFTGIAIREDTQGIFADVRKVWVQGAGRTTWAQSRKEPSPFYEAFGPVVFWKIWEAVRKLVCLTMGVGYVRQIKDKEAARELADILCETLYNFRMRLNEGGKESAENVEKQGDPDECETDSL